MDSEPQKVKINNKEIMELGEQLVMSKNKTGINSNGKVNRIKSENEIKNIVVNHEYKVDAYFKSLMINIEESDDYLLINKNIRANI